MPTLVIGYNVEWTDDRDVSESFLKAVRRRHEKLDAPCTLYLRREIFEWHHELIESLSGRELFDLQITIPGPMKTVCQVAENETSVWPGASIEEIEHEVRDTSRVVEEVTGEAPIGLSDSLGSYRGLSDRPDILQILDKNGIRFTRTWSRNEKDWQPVDFGIEPFWYTFQGFPHILEFPSQGWQLAIIRKLYGWDDTQGYADYLAADVDEVAERNDMVWSFWVQDWSALREDEDLTIMRDFIQSVQKNSIDIRTQRYVYEHMRNETEE